MIETYQDLDKFVRENVEGDRIEYKSSGFVNSCISKDDSQERFKHTIKFYSTFSSFLNSQGGVCILGVDDSSRLLDEGLDLNEFNEDRISRLISGNVSLHNEKLNIKLVHSLKAGNKGYFVITIPEGHTAHQCLLDQKYYGREGEEDKPLRDYVVRLLMFKSRYPLFKIFGHFEESRPSEKAMPALFLTIKNTGNVISKEWAVKVTISANLRPKAWEYINPDNGRTLSLADDENHDKSCIITNTFHMSGELLFLPQLITELRHPAIGSHLWFGFDVTPEMLPDGWKGKVVIEVFSENPEPQIFEKEFTPHVLQYWSEQGNFEFVHKENE